jgi:L-fuconolactonase
MIDAHVHIWRPGRNGCIWPTEEDGVLHRDFSLDDYPGTRAVLVQSQESTLDSEWLLDVAANDDRVAAVVGWADLTAPEWIAERPKLAGLRPMVQQREADWYDDPALEAGLRTMLDHGLRLDALLRVRHLPSLARLAVRFPALPIVIDHAAKPEIEGGFEAWREAIAPLAALPNVMCKLSGLLTECGDAPAGAVAPYAGEILALFEPERVMWGSDWPVVNAVSSYGEWLAQARALVPAAAHAAVFGGTAARFYGIEGPAA